MLVLGSAITSKGSDSENALRLCLDKWYESVTGKISQYRVLRQVCQLLVTFRELGQEPASQVIRSELNI